MRRMCHWSKSLTKRPRHSRSPAPHTLIAPPKWLCSSKPPTRHETPPRRTTAHNRAHPSETGAPLQTELQATKSATRAPWSQRSAPAKMGLLLPTKYRPRSAPPMHNRAQPCIVQTPKTTKYEGIADAQTGVYRRTKLSTHPVRPTATPPIHDILFLQRDA
jgi:hypothetical protein